MMFYHEIVKNWKIATHFSISTVENCENKIWKFWKYSVMKSIARQIEFEIIG